MVCSAHRATDRVVLLGVCSVHRATDLLHSVLRHFIAIMSQSQSTPTPTDPSFVA